MKVDFFYQIFYQSSKDVNKSADNATTMVILFYNFLNFCVIFLPDVKWSVGISIYELSNKLTLLFLGSLYPYTLVERRGKNAPLLYLLNYTFYWLKIWYKGLHKFLKNIQKDLSIDLILLTSAFVL